MKKTVIFFLIFICGSLFTSHAQTEKGNYLLGGTATINNRFSNGNSIFQFNLNPNAGIFIKDDLAIGSAIGLGLSSGNSASNFSFSLVPFLRYYFSRNNDLGFFFATGIGGGVVTGSNTESQGLLTASAGVGMVYFLNNSIGIETILGLNHFKIGESPGVTNLGLNIGFQIYFNRGSE